MSRYAPYLVEPSGGHSIDAKNLTEARKLAREQIRECIRKQKLDLPGGPLRPVAFISKLIPVKAGSLPKAKYQFLEKHKLDAATGRILRQAHLD